MHADAEHMAHTACSGSVIEGESFGASAWILCKVSARECVVQQTSVMPFTMNRLVEGRSSTTCGTAGWAVTFACQRPTL